MTVIKMTADQIKKVIIPQNQQFTKYEDTVPRAILQEIGSLAATPHILIITGIRRAGKSTLLKQINEKLYSSKQTYLNFEDERLLSFISDDFSAVHEAFLELSGKVDVFFFDEIQNVEKWEAAIRRFHGEGIKVIITGSNASLLNSELGTKLTGRHLDIVLYPFSFRDLIFRKTDFSDTRYLYTGKNALLERIQCFFKKEVFRNSSGMKGRRLFGRFMRTY